jgi:hypothetical protein
VTQAVKPLRSARIGRLQTVTGTCTRDPFIEPSFADAAAQSPDQGVPCPRALGQADPAIGDVPYYSQ